MEKLSVSEKYNGLHFCLNDCVKPSCRNSRVRVHYRIFRTVGDLYDVKQTNLKSSNREESMSAESNMKTLLR
jgi:hypothetical protein